MFINYMDKYIVTYTPARHCGVKNQDDQAFLYNVEITNFFQNWKSGEHFAGIRGKCAEGVRSFRWDRIVSIVKG